jgi:hypothetical protein
MGLKQCLTGVANPGHERPGLAGCKRQSSRASPHQKDAVWIYGHPGRPGEDGICTLQEGPEQPVKPEVEAVAGTAARSELELDFHRDGVTRLLFFCQAEVAEPSHLSWEGDYMVPTQDLVGREGHNSHFTDKETEVSKCLLLPAWLPSDHTALESNSSSSPKGLSLSLSLSLSRFLSLSLSLSQLFRLKISSQHPPSAQLPSPPGQASHHVEEPQAPPMELWSPCPGPPLSSPSSPAAHQQKHDGISIR